MSGWNKGSTPTGGTGAAVQDRFRQMNAQERLIEQKKKEIEQKLLAEKMKQHEDALNKMKPKQEKKTESKPSLFSGNRM